MDDDVLVTNQCENEQVVPFQGAWELGEGIILSE